MARRVIFVAARNCAQPYRPSTIEDMSRTPVARDKILDAYADLLRTDGERAATLEAVAARAGVSKGGLLYHFNTKEALAEALSEQMLELGRADLKKMSSAKDGPSEYYVRTSVNTKSRFDVTYAAMIRLSQAHVAAARSSLETIHRWWLELILEEVEDPSAAETIMLIGDGLYSYAALPGELQRPEAGADMNGLVSQVRILKQAAAEKLTQQPAPEGD